jgi:hypothetical protein
MDLSEPSSLVLRRHIDFPGVSNEDYEQPQAKRPRTDHKDNGTWGWDRNEAVATSFEHTSRGLVYKYSVGALATATNVTAHGEAVHQSTYFNPPQMDERACGGVSYIAESNEQGTNHAWTMNPLAVPPTHEPNVNINSSSLADHSDSTRPLASQTTSGDASFCNTQPAKELCPPSSSDSPSLVCFGMVSILWKSLLISKICHR